MRQILLIFLANSEISFQKNLLLQGSAFSHLLLFPIELWIIKISLNQHPILRILGKISILAMNYISLAFYIK